MSEPTEADRELARALMSLPAGYRAQDHVNRVAQALADERERARAPFLAVADEVHRRGAAEVAAMDDEPDEHRRNQCASRAATYARAEHLIRAATQDQP